MNVTVKELSKLYHLNREVELNMRQLAELEADCREDEQLLRELRESIGDCSSPPLSDMPKAHNVGSPVESLVLRIGQLESNILRKKNAVMNMRVTISARQTLCLLERERLEAYIDGIGDSLLRQIFTLRFVNGLSWEQVAASIGGGNKAESARRACYRYLKAHKSE